MKPYIIPSKGMIASISEKSSGFRKNENWNLALFPANLIGRTGRIGLTGRTHYAQNGANFVGLVGSVGLVGPPRTTCAGAKSPVFREPHRFHKTHCLGAETKLGRTHSVCQALSRLFVLVCCGCVFFFFLHFVSEIPVEAGRIFRRQTLHDRLGDLGLHLREWKHFDT